MAQKYIFHITVYVKHTIQKFVFQINLTKPSHTHRIEITKPFFHIVVVVVLILKKKQTNDDDIEMDDDDVHHNFHLFFPFTSG